MSLHFQCGLFKPCSPLSFIHSQVALTVRSLLLDHPTSLILEDLCLKSVVFQYGLELGIQKAVPISALKPGKVSLSALKCVSPSVEVSARPETSITIAPVETAGTQQNRTYGGKFA